MTELKPCPFCGEKPYLIFPCEADHMWTISCSYCCMELASVSKEEAVERWNTRHYPPMDELTQHFKNLEEDETLKRIDDAYNRGWNYAMDNPEVKKAVERMKPKKVIYDDSRLGKPGITEYSLAICPSCRWAVKFEDTASKFCRKCGQALDWSDDE